MTPAQIVTAARRKYNSEGASFYSDDELYRLIYQAELEMQQESLVIEATDSSTTTVSGTRTYAFPTSWIAVKRAEWNGKPLDKIDFKDDDDLTGDNPGTTSTGTPRYFFTWNDLVYLRPIPNAAQTLKLFGHKEPLNVTTATQVLELPTMFHMNLSDFLASEMAAKDGNHSMAIFYKSKWDKAVEKAKQWARRRKKTSGFSVVKCEEIYG